MTVLDVASIKEGLAFASLFGRTHASYFFPSPALSSSGHSLPRRGH